MDLLLIGGASGSGKSVALAAFEDAGYYTVNNIPVPLVVETADYLARAGQQRVAVALDVKTGPGLAGLMSEFTEKIFRVLQAPSFFPEVILDGKDYPYAVITTEASEAFILDKKILVGYLKDNPEMLWVFYQSMALDLRRAYRQIKNVALGDARSRVGAKLFALAHVHGQSVPEGVLISIPLSATDLAGMCSLARESVSRILGELKDLGIIQMEKKQITVKSIEKLKFWVHERNIQE
jgi:CRP/FNR family transcriptional regulator